MLLVQGPRTVQHIAPLELTEPPLKTAQEGHRRKEDCEQEGTSVSR